jgi:hypothetical protein
MARFVPRAPCSRIARAGRVVRWTHANASTLHQADLSSGAGGEGVTRVRVIARGLDAHLADRTWMVTPTTVLGIGLQVDARAARHVPSIRTNALTVGAGRDVRGAGLATTAAIGRIRVQVDAGAGTHVGIRIDTVTDTRVAGPMAVAAVIARTAMVAVRRRINARAGAAKVRFRTAADAVQALLIGGTAGSAVNIVAYDASFDAVLPLPILRSIAPGSAQKVRPSA